MRVVTTIDSKQEKRGFFSIYKPGQGKYVRWGTVTGLGLVALIGAGWLGLLLGFYGRPIQAGAMVAWLAVWSMVIFWVVNTPKLAEFMIMTESEMRKVTWPTRHATINSTKVVIFMTLVLASLLWLVDIGFMKLFEKLGIM
jgi:preprotein translocase subunit SecE